MEKKRRMGDWTRPPWCVGRTGRGRWGMCHMAIGVRAGAAASAEKKIPAVRA